MKKRKITKVLSVLILGFFCLQLLSCKSNSTALSASEKQELIDSADSLLTDWHKAAAEANYENYFGAMDSISIFIGTDASENWSKEAFSEFSKPYFDKGKAWSFSAVDRNIYTNNDGSFLWFDELLDTWMGLCRGSGVIENSNGSLKIKHYVLSVTIPNDNIQEVINIKKEKDSLFSRPIKNKLLIK
jgi:hypothetical protein